jgi:hypothetical protein
MQFMAVAVVCQLLSVEARFHSQAGPFGIFGGQCGTVTRSLQVVLFFPLFILPPVLHIYSFIINS